MNILITGIAGFIGSTLAKELSKNDSYNIIGIDNFNDYYNPEFKEENIKGLKIKLYRYDIRDFDKLKEIFKENKIDKIIHLASMVGVRSSIDNPFVYEEVNIKGTLNLLELAKEVNCKKFVFGSSSSIYGNCKTTPFNEKLDAYPISPYGVTKRSAELLCHSYSHLYNLPIVCLRFFTVYGPKGRPDMAPYKFTEMIFNGDEIEMFGDGTSKRDYTFVADIVDGIIKSLDLDAGFEIINLGNSNPIELNKLISLIEKTLNKKAKIVSKGEQPGDVIRTYADIKTAEDLLGYSPKVNIEEGIKMLCEWYVKNRANK
ncbi:MAG: GDP-mannose 4,6-dehydratase [Candidatus Woesearchaeota archaeon]|jgi:UDP-glucuronate 4-epimerase|nr:GDP-mannose 4,6-dehydratase [Candidatus Woesearchaeota archaeon]MDP7622774.1 GDP-mannose 4,6-dehydratase [Candidatus Woesearchaeota archaeon]HJN56450.1 GDP-mannose 4,6-dehydratase [Candidatus Woesearchaeota archaeon]|tara:strand:+ start:51753 stop:52697 length:945 start_codon:yes stop_codon:yes gene_type:complete